MSGNVGIAGSAPVPCQGCRHAQFCSTACAEAATSDPGSHCDQVCKIESTIINSLSNFTQLSDDQKSSLFYIVRIYSLILTSQSNGNESESAAQRLRQIIDLSERGPIPMNPSNLELQTQDATIFHDLVTTASKLVGLNPNAFSVTDVFTALEKDSINGYGILFAKSVGVDACDWDNSQKIEIEERQLRGSGLYPIASRINHECLPNATRFDNFDRLPDFSSPPGSNTSICLRMLHDLPAGEEITQSYFPLTWNFEERQERCREQYGFDCSCPRCKEEVLLSSLATEFDETSHGNDWHHEEENKIDSSYIDVFLIKYVCPDEGCEGTMAPLHPQVQDANQVLECSVCSRKRTEQEFLKYLDECFSSETR